MNKKTKILIVEDERIVAEDIKASLHNLGYIVSGLVPSGEEAILSVGKVPPDIILMDIMLRGPLTGIETAEKLRADYNIPIIYLTAYADSNTLDSAKRTEPFGYILKPFSDKELQSTIEMALYKYSLELELKKNRAFLFTALNSIADAVIITDEEGVISMMNPRAEVLLGCNADDAIGKKMKKFVQLVHEDTSERIADPVRNMLDKEVQTSLVPNLILTRKNGENVYVDESASRLKSEGGHFFGVIFAYHDITFRKQSEIALRDSEEKFRAITASAQDAIIIMDSDGYVSYWNPAAEKLFGYSIEETKGNKLHSLIMPDKYVKDHSQGLDEYKITGEGPFISKTLELEGRRKDGTHFPVELSLSLLKLKDEWHALGIVRDISERKKLEDEKQRVQDQFFQIQKMEAIGTLAGGIAHDFNNLLTAVCGHIDLALTKIDEQSPLFENFRQIMAACKSASGLVRQLLLFSHKQPVVLSTINLNMHIQEVLTMIERIIGEDIVIKTDFAQDLLSVQADYSNIEQVIMNLSINARDAMPDGGQLLFKTENIVLTEQDCKMLPEIKPGKFVQLTVSDQGLGIEHKDLPHIFEPFYTTKGDGLGTGLGLAVVYSIMKKHNGLITVSSELNKGTSFKLIFPATTKRDPIKIKETISLLTLQGDGKRVLIVEDQDSVREFARMALNDNGYVATEASSVKEAMEKFEKMQGKFDLVFSDVVLPDKTGIFLVEELLSFKPDLKVLLSSGYTDDRLQWPIIQKRGLRFLKKPYRLAELLQAVKDIFEQT